MRIGLIGENSINYVDNLIHIWNQGNCAVLIDWRIPAKAMIDMLRNTEVTQCYIENTYMSEEISKLCPEIEFIAYENSTESADELPHSICSKFHENYSKEEAVILFSSGTTGAAKGIVLTHYAINYNADLINDYMKLTNNDKIYIAKALAHSSTIVGELLIGLKHNVNIVLSSTKVTPRDSLQNIAKQKATILCVNPSLLYIYTTTARLLKMQFPNLRSIYVSGSVLDQQLIVNAAKVFKDSKICNVYGLTEAGPRVCAQIECDQSASVGRPLRDVTVKVINENGQETKPFEKGCVYIDTPCHFTCYIKKNKEIQLAEDGWFNTKDVGYFDEKGNLYITGRADNMVIVGSHNVYVEEVENKLKYGCDLQDCVVLSEKNNIYGERMVCFYTDDLDKTSELQSYCNENFANYERPYKFIKVDKLLTTYNGKKVREIIKYLS